MQYFFQSKKKIKEVEKRKRTRRLLKFGKSKKLRRFALFRKLMKHGSEFMILLISLYLINPFTPEYHLHYNEHTLSRYSSRIQRKFRLKLVVPETIDVDYVTCLAYWSKNYNICNYTTKVQKYINRPDVQQRNRFGARNSAYPID